MHEEPVPLPGRGEVQIRIHRVGLCASDLHYYRDGRIGTTLMTQPTVLGHEASGVVSAVGADVEDLRVGDRVAIEPAKPCGECEWCRAGHFNVCPGIPFFGTPPTDGCLRDYISWPAPLALKVPDCLSMDEAALVEPYAIGIYVAELARPEPDDAVLILGAGGIGLSVLMALRSAGAQRIAVSEPISERRQFALQMGADAAFDPSVAERQVDAMTGGRGADIVIECTGEDEAVRESCRLARVLGRLLIVGIPHGDDYTLDASAARRKQLSAVFVRRSNATAGQAIAEIEAGRANVAGLATHSFPLEDTFQAIELAMSRADGVVRAMVSLVDEQHTNDHSR